MFKFRSRESKLNEALLKYSLQGDGAYQAIADLLSRNKGRINVNTQSDVGNTALMHAVMSSGGGTVRVLLGFQADPNIVNKQGENPLMMALSLKLYDIARDLIVSGTKLDTKSVTGHIAADIAARSTDAKILSLLPYLKGEKKIDELKASLEQEKLDARVFAAALSPVAELKDALKAGGSANARNEAGTSALAFAATATRLDNMKVLLEAGARIDAPAEGVAAPLFQAIGKGFDAGVALLLQSGADIETKNADGYTPFAFALAEGYPNTGRLIAEEQLRRATTDEQKAAANKNIATADLVVASMAGNPFNMLNAIKRGAQIDVETTYGYTIMTRAAKNGQNFVLAMLLSTGANPDTSDAAGRVPVVEAAQGGNAAGVIGLIDAKADVNRQDKRGNTALQALLTGDNKAALDRLIAAKANPNLRGGANQSTYLETIARWEGNEGVILSLGKAGADLNQKDPKGRTPVMIAIEARWKSNVEAFLDAGADMLAQNAQGESVLDQIRKTGWADTIAKASALETAARAKLAAAEVTAPAPAPVEQPAPVATPAAKDAPKP